MIKETENKIIVSPVGLVKASVIWFHGLGADGYDFVPIVSELGIQETLGIRFVFPHAPFRPVTLNGGMTMRAWFDVLSLDKKGPVDQKGLEKARDLVEDLITEELNQGLNSRQIILAGFSQGAALVLYAGLRCLKSLGGMIALSGFLPAGDASMQGTQVANQNTPVFLAHGTADGIVPFECLDFACHLLTTHQNPITRCEYKGLAHGVNAEEISDVADFLKACLN